MCRFPTIIALVLKTTILLSTHNDVVGLSFIGISSQRNQFGTSISKRTTLMTPRVIATSDSSKRNNPFTLLQMKLNEVESNSASDNNKSVVSISKMATITNVAQTQAQTQTQAPTNVNETLKRRQMIIQLIRKTFHHTKKILSNFFFHSQFGRRGELFVIMELFLFYSLCFGKDMVVPIAVVNNIIQFIFGPMTFGCGLALIALSMKEFRSTPDNNSNKNVKLKSLSSSSSLSSLMSPYINVDVDAIDNSPINSDIQNDEDNNDNNIIINNNINNQDESQPKKTNNQKLITTGVYSYIRHPFYMGTICTFIGTSIMTKSTSRLIITLLYSVLINVKCQKEEYELLRVYKNLYMRYGYDVKKRFIPTKEKISLLVTNVLSLFS